MLILNNVRKCIHWMMLENVSIEWLNWNFGIKHFVEVRISIYVSVLIDSQQSKVVLESDN